jgi:c-di-GMP-binding flagellar brake protein YcgR
MSVDKRGSERHRVRFQLVYDDGESFNSGAVDDISEGGLHLETNLPLATGTIVRLTPLDDSSGHLFEVEARVVRATQDPLSGEPSGMGLQFVGLSPDERRALVAMIRALEARAQATPGSADPYLRARPAGPGR